MLGAVITAASDLSPAAVEDAGARGNMTAMEDVKTRRASGEIRSVKIHEADTGSTKAAATASCGAAPSSVEAAAAAGSDVRVSTPLSVQAIDTRRSAEGAAMALSPPASAASTREISSMRASLAWLRPSKAAGRSCKRAESLSRHYKERTRHSITLSPAPWTAPLLQETRQIPRGQQ